MAARYGGCLGRPKRVRLRRAVRLAVLGASGGAQDSDLRSRVGVPVRHLLGCHSPGASRAGFANNGKMQARAARSGSGWRFKELGRIIVTGRGSTQTTLAQPPGSPPWLTKGRLSRAGRWPSHRRPQAGLRLANRARSKAPGVGRRSRPDLPLGTAGPKLCGWTAPTSVIRVVERLRSRIRSWVKVPGISCS